MVKARKLGPVKVDKNPWLWKDVYRFKLVESFAGQSPTKEDLESPEGKAKIEAAQAAATEALGYSLEEAEDKDMLKEAVREITYARERTGMEELDNCAPEVL